MRQGGYLHLKCERGKVMPEGITQVTLWISTRAAEKYLLLDNVRGFFGRFSEHIVDTAARVTTVRAVRIAPSAPLNAIEREKTNRKNAYVSLNDRSYVPSISGTTRPRGEVYTYQ